MEDNEMLHVETDSTTTAETEEDILKTKDNNKSYYKEAVKIYIITFCSSLFYCLGIFFVGGIKSTQEYLISYLIEQSLSIDNMLVFLALFEYFKIPIQNQNKLLRWGILGAMVLRFAMISLGTLVVNAFNGVMLFFAGFLIYSGLHMLYGFIKNKDDDEEEDEDYSNNWIVKLTTYLFPATDRLDGDKFFTTIRNEKNDVKTVVTPCFICMIAIEISDIVFAVDSIPAIFGVTQNPFIIFTSNIFAIMGLRSLFIILSKAADDLIYLEPSVAIVLGFIGCKMIAESYFHIEFPIYVTLGFIFTMLFIGCFLSWCLKNEDDEDDSDQSYLNDEEIMEMNIEMIVKQQQMALMKTKQGNFGNLDDNVSDIDSHCSTDSTEGETVLEL